MGILGRGKELQVDVKEIREDAERLNGFTHHAASVEKGRL